MDGAFDDVWGCTFGATGRYTKFYVDWVADATSPKGGYLYFLNDWIANEEGPVPKDCFNYFSASC